MYIYLIIGEKMWTKCFDKNQYETLMNGGTVSVIEKEGWARFYTDKEKIPATVFDLPGNIQFFVKLVDTRHFQKGKGKVRPQWRVELTFALWKEEKIVANDMMARRC